jgi:glycosyltransferase involved in cell wall biosynthesis
MGAVILLPVYRPAKPLMSLLADLAGSTTPTVIVDDGSGPAADKALAQAADQGCTVLRCTPNRGKGTALKTGFRHILSKHPGADVVCADGDGQHSAADIQTLITRTGRGEIVLGVRQFDRMPLRSRVGNTLIALLFRAVTGRTVSDTQTGLRAYPADFLERLCSVPGERFEYEMNVLLEAVAENRHIEEVPIPTTYLNGNAASNFSGLTDSARVLRSLVLHATSN